MFGFHRLSRSSWQCVLLVAGLAGGQGAFGQSPFVRGDCNGDGQVAGVVTDAVFMLNFSFLGGDEPSCLDACDANGDGRFRGTVTDAVYLLNFLFLGGGPPPAPFPECGTNPAVEPLGCEESASCAVDCGVEARAIAKEAGIVGSCSAVVRLDYREKTILGWELVCGQYAEAPPPRNCECEGCLDKELLDPNAEDVLVYYWATADIGRNSFISARTALTLFCGIIIFDRDGRGGIEYPREWRPAATLGTGCRVLPRVVPVRAYDYDGEERLDPAEVEEVLDVVWRTALPEGLSTVGSIFDAVVVRFPRLAYIYEGDEIDPATAEWIVIVNAGRLE